MAARDAQGRPLPWRRLAAWSLLGTAIAALVTLADLSRTLPDLGHLVDTAPDRPPAALLAAELGPDAVREGGPHDGAFFYVIARDPFDLEAMAPHLDGPRYRVQRIGFPMAAWALHPTGGGWGLVWAMFAVGVVSIFLGGLATGALSVTWRGPPWAAVVFGAWFGSFVSLRIGVGDTMAVAAAVGAITLLVRRHLVWATVAGTLAVLTKELMILVLATFVASRLLEDRHRWREVVVVGIPGVASFAWFVVLARRLPAGDHAENFVLPPRGLIETFTIWTAGAEPLAWIAILLAVGLGVVAVVRRGLRAPLSLTLLAQMGLLAVLTPSVLGPERSATRQVMPLAVLAAVALVAPGDRVDAGAEARRSRASGTDGER